MISALNKPSVTRKLVGFDGALLSVNSGYLVLLLDLD